MKQKSLTSFIALLSIIIVAISVFGIFLFNQIFVSKSETVGAFVEIQEQKDKVDSLSSVRDGVEASRENIKTIDSSFINADDVASFIKNLESEADSVKASLSIGNIVFDPNLEGVVKPLTAHVDIEGSWSSVIMLIGRIERTPKSILIDRISIRKAGDPQSKTTSWKAAFDISAFVVDNKSL